jgi:hypothetical protein
MDWPLIYCNGDSYSDENYKSPVMVGKTYAHALGEKLNGFVINKAISGSCNRRIIRTTVSDMLTQRNLNPKQKIIVLIGLSFELRSELWVDSIPNIRPPEESNFRTHTFSLQINWRENLLAGRDLETPNYSRLDEKFYKQYSEGRAFFFSPYAERINLLCDIIMLRKFFESHNINFLIFQSPRAEKLERDFLLDQFEAEIRDDRRIFDFESFGFCNWCLEQKFVPMDFLDRPEIGHYDPDAHRAFAESILLPRLQETNQI